MNIPYITIRQKGEVFFITKFKISFLRDKVNFHFRDPYLDKLHKETEDIEKYINKLEKKGIDLKRSNEGIQRRLQLSRINAIKKFIESSEMNYFPNSILLSLDVSEMENFEDEYLKYEEQEIGHFYFPDNINFTIIDGQHRLAGMFLAEEEIVEDFEIPTILLFNTSLSTAAKLFSDINGEQKPVNKSLIYDLYENIDIASMETIKKYHTICQKFYTDPQSPLYRQIKMLGVGKGAISQAFFIDYIMATMKNTSLEKMQDIYTQLFFYFKAFQRVFPNDWPVPENFSNVNELDNYADFVLKERKSQLVKTNGFGAIVKIFPIIHKRSGGSYKGYVNEISKLSSKISWIQDPSKPQGTGKKFQDYLYKEMCRVLLATGN